MIDCKDFTVADGQSVSEDLTFCCLSNSDLTDGFVVSGFLDNQSLMLQSNLSYPAVEISFQNIMPLLSNSIIQK